MSASLRRLSAVLVALALLATPSAADEPPARPQQIVIISFDGANDVALWQRSRRLAAISGARFTYFLSCVFLLSPENRSLYKAPRSRAGRSNVGFAASKEDVGARLNQMWLARAEGHEIASHGCGHLEGGKWSAADWRSEFASFTRILRDAWRINGISGEPSAWRSFAENEIEGFRAPYLSAGPGLAEALRSAGYGYDASTVSRDPAAPSRRAGLSSFGLPMIAEGPKQRRVLAMDYNLFVRHSGGFEKADEKGVFEERTLQAFRAAFEKEYAGGRAPLQFGFHFTLMNGGAYWRALERFATETCTRPGVACISYADYLARSAPPATEAAGG